MQHFGMESHSTSDPRLLLNIWKHWLPNWSKFSSFTHNHHQAVYVPQPLIIMQNPNDIKSFFKEPSDIEMDDFSLPKWPLQIKKSLQSIWSAFQHDHTPVKALPGVPLSTLNDNPSLPIFLSTLSSLHIYDQATISFRKRYFRDGKGTRFVSIEAQDPQYYWINCHMDDTGIRFAMRVDHCLVIDPNPKTCHHGLTE